MQTRIETTKLGYKSVQVLYNDHWCPVAMARTDTAVAEIIRNIQAGKFANLEDHIRVHMYAQRVAVQDNASVPPDVIPAIMGIVGKSTTPVPMIEIVSELRRQGMFKGVNETVRNVVSNQLNNLTVKGKLNRRVGQRLRFEYSLPEHLPLCYDLEEALIRAAETGTEKNGLGKMSIFFRVSGGLPVDFEARFQALVETGVIHQYEKRGRRYYYK